MSIFLDKITEAVPALRAYALALTKNQDLADDLVQDCLERAINKRALWKPQGTVKSWLFKIMLNIYRNNVKQKRITIPIQDCLQDELSFAPTQLDAIKANELLSSLYQLPTDQYEALVLVSIDGFSYEESADILSIPIGTLMSRIHRARRSLKKSHEERSLSLCEEN